MDNVTRELYDWEKALIGAAVVVFVIVFVIVGCAVCILCLIIRKRIFGCLDRTWRNCSAIIGISNEQQAPVDNGQRAKTILYSRRPVQERGTYIMHIFYACTHLYFPIKLLL